MAASMKVGKLAYKLFPSTFLNGCILTESVRRIATNLHNDTYETNISTRNLSTKQSLVEQSDEYQYALEEQSLKHPDVFGVRDMFTVSDLFDARVHLGHKQGLRNEHMTPYIYGNRLGQDIIDLDQTAEHLYLALNMVAHLAFRQGILLFVCRNRQNAVMVEEAAKSCGEFAHCRYWGGGMFTNSTLQYKSVTRLPDACIFFGTQNNVFSQHKAVNEASKMQVLTVGVVDTDSDPRLIAYPIPGNDDSTSAIQLYTSLFKKAILTGKERRAELLGS